MLEFIVTLYAIGAFLTGLFLAGLALRDPELSNSQRIAFPIIGGLLWPCTWWVWFRK